MSILRSINDSKFSSLISLFSKIEDDASITCEAGNFADTAYVNVYYLQEDSIELTLMQDPEEIYEGDIIELACHAHGSPLPDFTFYRCRHIFIYKIRMIFSGEKAVRR